MARFTRGFSGRGQAARDPRLPPGQYDAGQRLAGAHRRGHAELDTDDVDVHASTGSSSTRRRGRGTRSTRSPPSTYDGRHPLRHDLVEVRDDVRRASRSTRCSRSRGPCRRPRTCWRPRHTGYTTNLPLADVTGGKAWVAWEVDGEPLPARARRPGAAARAAPLLLEEREVGRRAPPARPRRAGFWERNGYHDRGDPWLEQRYQGD